MNVITLMMEDARKMGVSKSSFPASGFHELCKELSEINLDLTKFNVQLNLDNNQVNVSIIKY